MSMRRRYMGLITEGKEGLCFPWAGLGGLTGGYMEGLRYLGISPHEDIVCYLSYFISKELG